MFILRNRQHAGSFLQKALQCQPELTPTAVNQVDVVHRWWPGLLTDLPSLCVGSCACIALLR
jgi:hypothetical protein